MRTFPSLILFALISALLSTPAAASSISLVVTDAGGGASSGADVTFGAGGGSVQYDIYLNATQSFSAIGASAAFPGASGTGTAVPLIGDGMGIIPLVYLDPIEGDDAMGQWAFSSLSAALSPGTYLLGTMTITTTVSTAVEVGVLTIDDGLLDPGFLGIPLASGLGSITVIPEPATAVLTGLGLLALAAGRRRAG